MVQEAKKGKKGTTDVNLLYGIGKYASDSWFIFQEGKKDVNPDDKELKWYPEETRREETHDL